MEDDESPIVGIAHTRDEPPGGTSDQHDPTPATSDEQRWTQIDKTGVAMWHQDSKTVQFWMPLPAGTLPADVRVVYVPTFQVHLNNQKQHQQQRPIEVYGPSGTLSGPVDGHHQVIEGAPDDPQRRTVLLVTMAKADNGKGPLWWDLPFVAGTSVDSNALDLIESRFSTLPPDDQLAVGPQIIQVATVTQELAKYEKHYQEFGKYIEEDESKTHGQPSLPSTPNEDVSGVAAERSGSIPAELEQQLHELDRPPDPPPQQTPPLDLRPPPTLHMTPAPGEPPDTRVPQQAETGLPQESPAVDTGAADPATILGQDLASGPARDYNRVPTAPLPPVRVWHVPLVEIPLEISLLWL